MMHKCRQESDKFLAFHVFVTFLCTMEFFGDTVLLCHQNKLPRFYLNLNMYIVLFSLQMLADYIDLGMTKLNPVSNIGCYALHVYIYHVSCNVYISFKEY